MNKNEQITYLAEEIMVDITNNRLPLHNILLKASRLSLLLDMPENVKLFQDWAKYAEQNLFAIESFKSNIDSAKDPDVSISSANPSQYVWGPHNNFLERKGIRDNANQIVGYIAHYRTSTYDFVLNIYSKWQFGNIAESIFERKRKKADPVLKQIFADIHQRLNSIEKNIASDNPEDWKNAVVSCRTLLMDIADVLNPVKNAEDKKQYINRLKSYISPLEESKTKKRLLKIYLDELKKRLEYTSDLTQGGAHQQRPQKEEAEDVILYVYLMIAELMNIYSQKTVDKLGEPIKDKI